MVREGEDAAGRAGGNAPLPRSQFRSAAELLAIGGGRGPVDRGHVRRNETAWRPPAETDAGLDRIWAVMEQCIERGCRTEGVLPGGLNVQRRACRVFRDLQAHPARPTRWPCSTG